MPAALPLSARAAIMKGTMGIIPTVDFSTAEAQSFMNAFHRLPSSVTVLPDGRQLCHNDTDSDGETYLYKRLMQGAASGPYTCTGMDYSQIALNGSNISNLTLFAYDAVYALAYAVDAVVKDNGGVFPSSLRGNAIREALWNNVSFLGASGPVSFSRGLEGYESYGAGTRRTGAFYQVVNYHVCTYASTGVAYPCRRTIGTIHSEKGYQACSVTAFSDCTDTVIFNTEDNTKPLDWPHPVERLLPSSLATVLWLLA
eukprot:gene5428-6927_t